MNHISTEDLERFLSGRVSDALAVTGIEQHLSECQECADRLLAIERFISLVRAGAIRGIHCPRFPASYSAWRPFENKLRKV